MSQLTSDQLAHVFRGVDPNVPVPLFDERASAVRHAGDMLVNHFDGSFVTLIDKCNGSAQTLMEEVLAHFPTFRDEATYHGQRVYLYKRVQILVADLWACFNCTGLGRFDDIDTLTMFADYRVPQALVHLGLLIYSPSLNETLARGDTLLRNGDEREVEIRAASIWAVERVRRKMVELVAQGDDPAAVKAASELKSTPLNAVMLDFYIWDYAKARQEEMHEVPIHRTRSVYY
ncbi:UPF0553 protein C9orf64-like protein [Catenaria anguillulae PL171]|uniref:Queuosine 5'-phosphate N-glycosylase/hydrolase n=1 Tax=Catenaria anguillulae PL171 TaxID=765915 RepID=A0A1Y2HRH6_9FUNG|nr:UPF0553 protein C9orf64-like protein [Catenaria anguillulae PL171]